MRSLLLLLLTSLGLMTQLTGQIPRQSSQVLVGVADDWDASRATLTLYEKKAGRWQVVDKAWQARLGKKGLAWGRGLHPRVTSKAPLKQEGDWRAPAGIFKIGNAYGYAAQIAHSPRLTYRQITPRDLWVEDRNSPSYNKHIVLKNPPATRWEKKAQMRQNDHAHSLKLYIAHNDAIMGGQPVAGAGSAIFFHIWRDGGTRPTAGCTTMHETQLKQLIARIDPAKKPVYVLLPKSEYKQFHKSWKLP